MGPQQSLRFGGGGKLNNPEKVPDVTGRAGEEGGEINFPARFSTNALATSSW